MKKSELKKRILEALTPDEASKVDAKYKEIYAGMVGKNPLKMKKYDNPDKVAYGRAINLIQKESLKLAEKLGKDADLGDHIDDFTDSDAPQFKGKSKKKIRQMATAAFLNKEEQKLDEIDNLMEKEEKTSEDRLERIIKSVLKKEGGAAGLDPLKKAIKGEDTDKDFDIEKFIKKIDSVETHDDGDIIDTAGLNEGHSLDQKDLDTLESLRNQIEQGTLNSKKQDAYVKVLDYLIKSNIKQGDLGTKVDEASGQEKSKENYSNYFKKMDKNRLEEFVKEALKNPKKADLNKDGKLSSYEKTRGAAIEKSIDKVDETATIKKYPTDTENKIKNSVKSAKTFAAEILRHIEAVKAEEPQGDQYVGGVLKPVIAKLKLFAGSKEDEPIPESFDSLAKKLDKQKGITKDEAGKIAGKIANIKRKGGGKGPTAKQKKRMAETILKELRGNVNEDIGPNYFDNNASPARKLFTQWYKNKGGKIAGVNSPLDMEDDVDLAIQWANSEAKTDAYKNMWNKNKDLARQFLYAVYLDNQKRL